MLGFPDGAAYNSLTGLVTVPMQSRNSQFVYDVGAMIRRIELEAKKPPRGPIDPFFSLSSLFASFNFQLGRDSGDGVPTELSGLLRGLLSTIPIDVIEPATIVNADYGFIASKTQAGSIDVGVPPTGPFGETPNQFGPINAGRLPRGPSSQVAAEAKKLSLVDTPYNTATSMLSFPSAPLSIDAGMTATAEVHSGALHETHGLVSYLSQGTSRSLTLHYDSGRAEPRPMIHFGVAGVGAQPTTLDTRMVVSMTARLGDDSVRSTGYDKPTDAERVAGFEGGENFFTVP